MSLAVTFDFGQTLTELDADFLATRMAERGVAIEADRVRAAQPEAWRLYDAHCSGPEGGHPWKILMTAILRGAGAPTDRIEESVDWLWTEQLEQNLWRKPIDGMIELVRRVAAGGTTVAVISNSEGRLAHLAEQLGWQDDFAVIADSGLLGFAKPGARIFEWTAEAIGTTPAELIHIGDSWAADVEGILALGGRAVWFGGATVPPLLPEGAEEGPRLRFTRSAAELEEALRAWQVPVR
jgi:putative hydrolase of the HAD superfamily